MWLYGCGDRIVSLEKHLLVSDQDHQCDNFRHPSVSENTTFRCHSLLSSKDCLNLGLSHAVYLKKKNKKPQNTTGFSALLFKYCSRVLWKVLPSYMVRLVWMVDLPCAQGRSRVYSFWRAQSLHSSCLWCKFILRDFFHVSAPIKQPHFDPWGK